MVLGAKLPAPSISLISTNFWSSGTDALLKGFLKPLCGRNVEKLTSNQS